MERAIDAEVAKKRLQAWIDESDAQGFDKAATCFRDCISLLDAVPTLTPPNEPLTIEQLREMDGPVWCACKPIEGGDGYWCLCRHGHITTPAGTFFEVGKIPHWAFYRSCPMIRSFSARLESERRTTHERKGVQNDRRHYPCPARPRRVYA